MLGWMVTFMMGAAHLNINGLLFTWESYGDTGVVA